MRFFSVNVCFSMNKVNWFETILSSCYSVRWLCSETGVRLFRPYLVKNFLTSISLRYP